MPGINTTGTPNTEDYNLGRGIVYFSTLNASEHLSSREGLKTVDKEVVVSQKMTLSLTLDEINFQNLALLFSGETATLTNPSIAGFAKYEMITAASGGVELGRWYDIVDASGIRCYDIQVTGELILNNGDDEVLLVEGTDYEEDLVMGRVFLLTTATKISAAEALDVTVTANAAAVNVDEVRSLTTTAVIGALKFIAENPASSDTKTEYQFHKVSLKAEGDYTTIGDEFTQMQFTAVAEKNEVTPNLSSPTLTVRTFAQA
jgi:hypothetical protein